MFLLNLIVSIVTVKIFECEGSICFFSFEFYGERFSVTGETLFKHNLNECAVLGDRL